MTPLLLRTANRWKIPRDLALAVIARDSRCIYCNREFGLPQGPRAACASWEHIVNDETLINAENIALCCVGCNASKGTRLLKIWIDSRYCNDRGISRRSLAKVAADAFDGQSKSTDVRNR
jgi:hypothetical protein